MPQIGSNSLGTLAWLNLILAALESPGSGSHIANLVSPESFNRKYGLTTVRLKFGRFLLDVLPVACLFKFYV
jgi:hypothetical protein